MSTLIKVILAVIVIAVVGGIVANIYNTAITHETGIEKTYKNNQNVLSGYSLKIAEAAQVPGIAREDIVAVIQAAVGGRYGDKGSQATWQWIKEQNPSVDPSLYRTIQTMIDAGRNKFENAQTILLDQCAEYQNYRSYLFSGLALRILGFPKNTNLEKMCTPIKSEYAAESFDTGIEKGLKLR